MVSRGVDDGDAVIAESLGLLKKEALRLERKPLTVEKIAGDQEGVHIFANGEIDCVAERLSGGVAQPLPDRLGSSGE